MVWFPEHVLRWIGHSGSPMGTEGDSQKSHSTVVAAVGSLPTIVEKGMGKVRPEGLPVKPLLLPPIPGMRQSRDRERAGGE